MTKTIIYVGLADKDSKQQEITTLDAYKIMNNIFIKTTGGATITEASGIYTHDNGEVVCEKTLIATLFGADAKDIDKACTMIKLALNQESVIIETMESNSRFF